MSSKTTLPKGALVLVTGVNGFIAAHVAQQFLQRGYKVRGTVRSLSKSAWLEKELFKAEASNGSFELVEVEDMTKDNAFDEAVRGVAAVIHLATIATWDPNPNNVVPTTVAGVLGLLRSASQQASVKQFVYTSTIGAAAVPAPNTPFHVDANSWNDTAVSLAWAPEPYEPERGIMVYMASKVEAERAFWKFIKEEKPGFRGNAVLPFTTFGPLLHAQQNVSTDGWLFGLYEGNTAPLAALPAAVSVDVRDIAALHVAAALDPAVQNARLFGWAEPFNWNDILAIYRKLEPKKTFVDDLEGLGELLGTVDASVEKGLVETWGGRGGWISLEEGVRAAVQGIWPKTS